MLRKDYFVRQLEEFGKVLGTLLFLKREKDWEKFEQEIANAAQRFTAIELNYVEQLPEDDFIKDVIEKNQLNLEQKHILAGILFEQMDFYAKTEQHENYISCAKKCLLLYKFLKANQTQNEFNLETHYRLEFLKGLGL